MKDYDVALILQIKASSYSEALHIAKNIAQGLACEGENVCAVFDYETDNEGQRVLYLPKVNE